MSMQFQLWKEWFQVTFLKSGLRLKNGLRRVRDRRAGGQ